MLRTANAAPPPAFRFFGIHGYGVGLHDRWKAELSARSEFPFAKFRSWSNSRRIPRGHIEAAGPRSSPRYPDHACLFVTCERIRRCGNAPLRKQTGKTASFHAQRTKTVFNRVAHHAARAIIPAKDVCQNHRTADATERHIFERDTLRHRRNPADDRAPAWHASRCGCPVRRPFRRATPDADRVRAVARRWSSCDCARIAAALRRGVNARSVTRCVRPP